MKLGVQVDSALPHCLRWGPAPHPPKGHSPHICCGQMAVWIKMPLGVKVGLGPGDFVLDGTQLPQKGAPLFSAHVYCGQTAIKMPLGMEVGLGQSDIVLVGDPAPPQKRGGYSLPQFSAHFYCGQMVVCIRIPLGTEVGLSLGDVVLGGPSSPSPKGAQPLSFRPVSIVAKRLDG